jgi:TonB-dependent receptor
MPAEGRFSNSVAVVIGLAVAAAMTAAPAARAAPPAAAETGTLRGRAQDAQTGKALPFTNVSFYKVIDPQYPAGFEAGGALSQKDGTFSARLPAGTYRVLVRYVSYERAELRDVVVRAGAVTEITAQLVAKPIEVKAVKVTGDRIRDKEAALLVERKKSESISDAISSELMSKSTDSNAAEALERVTGLTVVEGKYVFVRGLGERYSATQINGASVGTPEPNKRVVPLDLLPTGALDNIQVQKSFTPDMDGEFGGGVVSVNTREFQQRLVNQSLSLGLEAGGPEALGYDGGALDFLGFDDGTRSMPDLIHEIAGNRKVGAGFGLTPEQIQSIGRAFTNVWTPRPGGNTPSFSYSGAFADQFTVRGKQLGFLTTLSLSNAFSSLERQDNQYFGGVEITADHTYDIHETQRSVLGGVSSSLNLKLAADRSLKLSALYTRQADDEASISEGFDIDTGILRTYRLAYVERGLLSTVLSGEQPLGGNGSKLDWTLSYSEAVRNEPDRREAYYERPEDRSTPFVLSTYHFHPVQRLFGRSEEWDRGIKVNWLKPVTRAKRFESSIKLGMAARDRNRNSGFRRFGFRWQGTLTAIDRTRPAEELLIPENIGPRKFELQETTRENDNYFAQHLVNAGYGLADIRLWEQLRLVAGARYEQSEQTVAARSPFYGGPVSDVRLEDADLLPAYNLTWNATSKMNLRLGYSLTLNRPELRELAPFSIYNYEEGYLEEGDPRLTTARLRNYDVRWEMFPGRQELLAVSVFRKKLDRPIEKALDADVTGYRLTPRNGLYGELQGAEVEVRAGLGSMWRVATRPLGGGRKPGRLDDWALSFNWSRVESEVDVLLRNGTRKTTPLNGQSTHATNIGLFYGTKRVDGALLYKDFGRRLSSFSLTELPDVYEHPARGLDLSLGWNIWRSSRVRISAENLLDESVEYRQGDLVTRRWSPGRKVGLQFAYKM